MRCRVIILGLLRLFLGSEQECLDEIVKITVKYVLSIVTFNACARILHKLVWMQDIIPDL